MGLPHMFLNVILQGAEDRDSGEEGQWKQSPPYPSSSAKPQLE